MRISDLIDGRQSTPKNHKKAKILTFLILITGILSLTFVAVTVYGQFTGTFVLNLSEQASERGIEISNNQAFTSPQTSLTFVPLEGAKEFVYTAITKDELEELIAHDGQYNGGAPYYIGYTFYLRNSGTLASEVVFTIAFTQVVNDLNEVVKVQMIHSYVDDTVIKSQRYGHQLGADPKNFKNYVIGDESIGTLAPGDIRKFTLIVWLNGPDTLAKHVNGAVKMEMTFTIFGERQ